MSPRSTRRARFLVPSARRQRTSPLRARPTLAPPQREARPVTRRSRRRARPFCPKLGCASELLVWSLGRRFVSSQRCSGRFRRSPPGAVDACGECGATGIAGRGKTRARVASTSRAVHTPSAAIAATTARRGLRPRRSPSPALSTLALRGARFTARLSHRKLNSLVLAMCSTIGGGRVASHILGHVATRSALGRQLALRRTSKRSARTNHHSRQHTCLHSADDTPLHASRLYVRVPLQVVVREPHHRERHLEPLLPHHASCPLPH